MKRHLITITSVSCQVTKLVYGERAARNAFRVAKDDWRNIWATVEEIQGATMTMVASFNDRPILNI